MDEIYGMIDGRLQLSIADSTMMGIMQRTMDEAHEKVKSKQGMIERFSEISKFYLLAVMQLEGCLKFVQREAEHNDNETTTGGSTSHVDFLAGLNEIRDRLLGRLRESEMALSEKDRELSERFENELKLRKALERKEKELVSLRENIQIERTKSEEMEEYFIIGNHEETEDKFSELKSSVDQQVWNIKQQLESDQTPPTNDVGSRGFDFERVEKMGSDIDILKETLDLAFVKMKTALLLSGLGPVEQQVGLSVEKDVMGILLRGSLRDFRERLEAEVIRQEKHVTDVVGEQLSDLLNEVTGLRDEMEPFINHSSIKASVSAPASQANSRPSSPKTGEGYGGMLVKSYQGDFSGENALDGKSHSVSQIVKNHEAIIRGKSQEAEELNRLRQEIREKPVGSSRIEKDPGRFNKRIQEIVDKLEKLITRNKNADIDCHKSGGLWTISGGSSQAPTDESSIGHGGEELVGKKMVCLRGGDRRESGVDSLVEVWKKIDKVPSFFGAEVMKNEISMLRQVKEDAEFTNMIRERTCITVFKGLISKFYDALHRHELESLVSEGICRDVIGDVFNQWNELYERSQIEAKTREDIFNLVFREALKNSCLSSSNDFAFAEGQNLRSEDREWKPSVDLEDKICGDICTVIFKEMVREFQESMDDSASLCLLREDIAYVVLNETMRQIGLSSFLLHSSVTEEEFLQGVVDGTMKETDDYYHAENMIRQEIYQIIFTETENAALNRIREAQSQIQERTFEELSSTKKPSEGRQVDADDGLIQKLDLLSKCLKVGEDTLESASSEMKMHAEVSKVDEEGSFTSLKIKLEKAEQQVVTSRTILGELWSWLGIAAGDGDSKKFCQVPTPTEDVVCDDGKPFCLLPKEIEEEHSHKSGSLLSAAIPGFANVVNNFELRATQKLGMTLQRLEEVRHEVEPVARLVASLKEKESIYIRAFVSRCQSLQKAEREVDLLGDQVDGLLWLLEKIYLTLNQHLPVLRHCFNVTEILALIKRELSAGRGLCS